jgi:DNA-directed RNA polymerase subunit omega
MEAQQNIDSKYRFILLSAKRARQLQSGARPLIQTASKRPTKVAQLEVASNLVPFENLQAEPSTAEAEPAK